MVTRKMKLTVSIRLVLQTDLNINHNVCLLVCLFVFVVFFVHGVSFFFVCF